MGSKGFRISSKFILLALAILIFSQLLLTAAYDARTFQQTRAEYENRIMEQIANTLHIMQVSPDIEANLIAKVSEHNQLSVRISKYPTANIQVDKNAYWSLPQMLSDHFRAGTISVQLTDNRWANFRYAIKPSHFIFQLSILGIECFVAGVLLLSAWYIERFTGPLHQFKLMAEGLGIQSKPEPLVQYGPRIIKETADAMNQMQERILQLLNDRNTMLAAISHDLRTPLTRLKLRMQFLSDATLAGESLGDIDEMEQMIQQILAYTQDAAPRDQKVSLDLVALLQTIADEYADMGYSVSFFSDLKRLSFLGHPLSLKRAFTNLVGNGIKYAQHVDIILFTHHNTITIQIEDDGPGIPEALLSKVFTPFYRVDSARNDKKGGSGLGLAIAHDVIVNHQGLITLGNRDHHGLRVTIEFSI